MRTLVQNIGEHKMEEVSEISGVNSSEQVPNLEGLQCDSQRWS